MSNTKLSKLMSLVLRHSPDKANLKLQPGGWVEIDELLHGLEGLGHRVSQQDLESVVSNNVKRRFAIDGTRIRANQGHSVPVNLGLEPSIPPETLFHGTVERFVESIRREGIQKMKRHHVHLSDSVETAQNVGSRRGEAVILSIRASEMSTDGILFYKSENGVWLVDQVPSSYINEDI